MDAQPTSGPRLLTAAELVAADNIAPPDKLLDPLLTCKTLALLHGPRGLGKTFVALSIARAVASGGSFLGWQAPAPRRVLYVDGEMAAFDMRERLRLLGEPPPLLEFLMADLNRGLPDLGHKRGLMWLLDRLHIDDEDPAQRRPPALLVLDNLASLVGHSTNDPDRWTSLQQILTLLRRIGIAVLIVHHTNKKGLQRGTSRREDVLDLVLGLRRPTDYKPSDGAHFDLHFDKARGLQGGLTEPLRVRLVTGQDMGGGGAAHWQWQSAEHRELDRAVDHFREGYSPEDVGELLGVSRSKAYELRKRAIALGRLEGAAA